MQSLVLVDDMEIRKKAFSRIDRLLKKLQRMEANLESFFSRDKRLFTEWFELTFRASRQQLDLLRGEYRELVEFHNWMHALAEMEDLPLTEAALRIREEIRMYVSGSDDDRRNIDNMRALRDDFVRAQLHENQKTKDRRRAAREEDEMSRARSQTLDPSDIEELEHFSSLSDAEIEEWCSDSEVAQLFLGKILRVASFTGDYHLFFRVWDLLHPKVQQQFARDFQRKTGESLDMVLASMREKVELEDAAEEAFGGEPLAGTPNERAAADEPKPLTPKVETFKLLYRQLARKLHPDMNSTPDEADWRKNMWLRVQSAYKDENLKEMTKLYHLVLLRSRDWQALRISELHITHEWLSDEISTTNDYLKDLRRQPAWGFSRRKNFAPIEKKIERDLARERKVLEEQVTDLRIHHNFLERMGRESKRRR